MKKSIATLLALWDNRPRRRIDYSAAEDKMFCNEIMVALKHADTDIKLAVQCDTLSLVQEFHDKFVTEAGVPIDKVVSVRPKLAFEENTELLSAIIAHDRIAQLDALCDSQYILDGSWIALGFSSVKGRAMAEVHRSNMTKVGSDGKPIIRADGKILKPEGYQPPQLEQFVDMCAPVVYNYIPEHKPTIEELEKVLAQETAPKVLLNPDGSLTTSWPTSQSPSLEAAGTPSNDALTKRAVDSSNRIPELTQNMVGNASDLGRKADTDNKPASSAASAASARMALPTPGKASRIAPRRAARPSSAGAPPPEPPATQKAAPASNQARA